MLHLGNASGQEKTVRRMLLARNFIFFHRNRVMAPRPRGEGKSSRVLKPRFTWETKLRQLADHGSPIQWGKLNPAGKRIVARKLILGVIQGEKMYERDDLLVERVIDRLDDIRVDSLIILSRLNGKRAKVSDGNSDDILSARSRLFRYRRRIKNFITILDGVMDGIRKGEYP